MSLRFADFFAKAMGSQGRQPHAFQTRFAESPLLHNLLPVPTGGGKTATAILGWLYRRCVADERIRIATPRRMVYCLPMRTLVDQTHASATVWLGNLGLTEVKVHKLLGGDVDDDWALNPESDAILIGTQDMLLSRALNRGYAQGRFRWSIDFGLLNNDCLWVYDEVQLMASGLTSSAQLAGLRRKLGTFGPRCESVWMSATMDSSWLNTIDLRQDLASLISLDLPDGELTSGDLGRRMLAKKTLRAAALPDVSDKKYAGELAKLVAEKHKPGRLTLVVLNTVDRAKDVCQAIRSLKTFAADCVLIHSRFRPQERERLNARLVEKLPDAGRIVVATQVVEAGVDISARVLFTELAPWSSIVQRLGRCHRAGEFDEPGEAYWVNLNEEKSANPYEPVPLQTAREYLRKLEGKDCSPMSLRKFQQEEKISLAFAHEHILRRRDLLDLFDTAPDLSGNDIDIARFVRGDDLQTDVSVFWREIDAKQKPIDQVPPRRDELCPVPIGQLKKFIDDHPELPAYRKDHIADDWVRVRKGDVRPGGVVLLPCSVGGYDWKDDAGLGWCGDPKKIPTAIASTGTFSRSTEEGVGQDSLSEQAEQTLVDHTVDVCAELGEILKTLGLESQYANELKHAARWHDLGKAHLTFQNAVRRVNTSLDAGKVWAKSGRKGRLLYERKHFRHELASALAMVQLGHSFLSAYLVAAHHGRVRLSIRSVPGETGPTGGKFFALGVHQDDNVPETDLGEGVVTPMVSLSLAPMLLGGESWTAKALEQLATLGPFRLAFLEALLRAADMRASKNPKTGVHHA